MNGNIIAASSIDDFLIPLTSVVLLVFVTIFDERR